MRVPRYVDSTQPGAKLVLDGKGVPVFQVEIHAYTQSVEMSVVL